MEIKTDHKCISCHKVMLKKREDLEKQCSACEAILAKEDKEFLRISQITHKKRNCRVCKKALPINRYFHCVACADRAGATPFIYSFQI